MKARKRAQAKKPEGLSDGYTWASLVLLVAYVAIHLPMLGRSLVAIGGILSALVFGE